MTLVTVIFTLFLAASSSASAAEPPPVLWGGPGETVCPTGAVAGHCRIPRGIAANRSNGHIYVGDQTNKRVDEFNALGQFIKSWGWDVVESGPDNDTTAPANQFEICRAAVDVCKAGASGSGVGQFASLHGLAVDSAGNVYVVDSPNHRVQEFNRKGEFLLMFGGGVDQGGGTPATPGDICTAEYVAKGDTCGAGTTGTASGQFSASWVFPGSYIAITSDDKVYVGDIERIQRFDTGGHWQANISLPGVAVQSLAVDSAGNLYYVDSEKPNVHKIGPGGEPKAPGEFKLKVTASGITREFSPTAVAVDSESHVFAFGPTNFQSFEQDPIFEFKATDGEEPITRFGKGEFSGSTGLATNLCAESAAPGNLYVTNAALETGPPQRKEAFLRAYGTAPIGCFRARTLPADPIAETAARLNGTVNPKGEAVTECLFEYGTATSYGHEATCEEPSAGEIGTGSTPVPVHANVTSLEKGTVYHFRLIAKVGGEVETGADETFKTLGPPVISEAHAAGVTSSEATLKAKVNPEGFATTYRFEYATLAAFEAHGFEGAKSTPQVALGADREAHQALANLSGLSPGTAYRWRILATNSSGSGEAQRTLFTYRPPSTEACANEAFRSEASASLPDCRAYEMVSPLDKNGGDIVKILDNPSDSGGYVQAAPDGNRLTYTAMAAFGSVPNAFNFNQYLAGRRERGTPGEGWSSEGIDTPVAGQEVEPNADTFGLFRQFMAFTPDLCSAWLIDHQTPPPTADGQVGYANLYRRESCGAGAGGFEALISSPEYALPGGTEEGYVDNKGVEGYSADGLHAIFMARARLLAEAAAGSGGQLYERSGGGLHVVSVLPNGSPGDPAPGDGQGFAAPGFSEVGSGVLRNLDTAVSADGGRVYWSQGKLYLREHPEQGIVAGECTAPSVACTVPVSAGSGFFWAASGDGSKALYTEGEDLREFDLGRYEAEPASASRLVAHHVKGVAGESEDLGRVYFVSTDALPGAGKNSEGDEALAGKPNLYLAEGEAFSFIGTLLAGDTGTKEPGLGGFPAYNVVAENGFERATRVSADGGRIAFESRAPLTGYDNTGPDGRAAVEVFAYGAGGALECVSCNPSGGRPSAAPEMREPYQAAWQTFPTKVPAAAWIPTWEHPLHASNLLSADGSRLFFNAADALVPRDNNGAQDVYEWEALGTGGCEEASGNYFAQNGGCLYLISSGESAGEAEFWEASTDGRDVFFTTEASLLPRDPGSVDLYDARVGGGFPEPQARAACEGEACQSPPEAPNDPTPASSSFEGAGNVHEEAPPPARCSKGKVRRKGRCVAKHHKRAKRAHHRAANANRRAAR